ncbi:EamA family transporter [Herbiconiux sp.]|uniref:DMT family transporter n=1 Tax=Herbiconiux sp. TaxID=1871186 RepID=UPI0025B832AC|nr:EamA family transporter [Herbiconiux sp.]
MMPVFAVLLAAICFGTTGTAQAFGPADASAGSVGAARILIGGGLLGIVAIVLQLRARSRTIRPGEAGGGRLRHGVPSWLLVAVGALGVLTYQPAFFAGTSANGVAVGTVVALGSAPVLTGLLDWALRRRFPGRRWLLATIVATAGVVLISGLVGAGTSTVSLPGILASLGAGASYAVYTLAAKALLQRGWGATSTMGTLFGVAALGSIPLLLASDAAWLLTADGLALALWLGVVTTALAYLLFGWGLARLPAATVSTLTLAEPLTATVLGTLVLGELLSGQAVAGLIVLAAGLVILAFPGRRRAALAGA